ncbi:MAG: hemerythrin domain-containing protein [Gammaproteobacteria bacterium]
MTADAPAHPRQLGDARRYTADEVSARLQNWHAPRVNRWERLRVTAGALTIELLTTGGVTRLPLAAGATRWFAPGTRWRVARMDSGARFELELHAASRGQAEAPEPRRSELLDGARRVQLAGAAVLSEFAGALAAGERCIVVVQCEASALPVATWNTCELFWHPLAVGAGTCTALLARSGQAFDLPIYLGRDHAVIEATLGGALAGDAERVAWLHATLERHLRIEEQLIFPAYLDAGGHAAWVRGLEREHAYLRAYLAELEQLVSRRKFLRLLDGHDEKEERVVYPDIRARLGARAGALLGRALAWPLTVAG